MSQINSPSDPTTQEPDRSQIVNTAIKEISHIATLPEITLKIIKLIEDPNSTAQDLNKVIAGDPALGARILKVVNSAFYGLPGQIGSINRAIVLLGLNAVKNIAIAASLAKLFRGGEICPGFAARDLWVHSIAVASGTSLLADKVGLGLPDEAFLAGLIHDIGIMVEIQARRPKFVEAYEGVTSGQYESLREAELFTLGATHEDFGSGLCKQWKFPASFAFVTGYHHHPMDLPEGSRTLAAVVHVADVLAARAEMGFTGTIETKEINPAVMKELGLTNEQLEEIVQLLPQAVEDANILVGESAAA